MTIVFILLQFYLLTRMSSVALCVTVKATLPTYVLPQLTHLFYRQLSLPGNLGGLFLPPLQHILHVAPLTAYFQLAQPTLDWLNENTPGISTLKDLAFTTCLANYSLYYLSDRHLHQPIRSPAPTPHQPRSLL